LEKKMTVQADSTTKHRSKIWVVSAQRNPHRNDAHCDEGDQALNAQAVDRHLREAKSGTHAAAAVPHLSCALHRPTAHRRRTEGSGIGKSIALLASFAVSHMVGAQASILGSMVQNSIQSGNARRAAQYAADGLRGEIIANQQNLLQEVDTRYLAMQQKFDRHIFFTTSALAIIGAVTLINLLLVGMQTRNANAQNKNR
jgi:hypothetical protein